MCLLFHIPYSQEERNIRRLLQKCFRGTVVQSEKHRELHSGHGSGQKVGMYAGSKRDAGTASEHCLGTLEHGTKPPNAQIGPCNKLVKSARFLVHLTLFDGK